MTGRGRGRGFGRGQPFPSSDQVNAIVTEKVSSTQHSSPYPPLDHFPASLCINKDYDDIFSIQSQLLSRFQLSNYYLKEEDENVKLFSSSGETTSTKKTSLNFDWDYFPLELRPTGKRKLKNEKEILDNLRKSKIAAIDLTWLDKLEEKEKKGDAAGNEIAMEEEPVKKEGEEDRDEEEVEEFDDEELDLDTDYNINYFDNGEDYSDEDNGVDEGPCF